MTTCTLVEMENIKKHLNVMQFSDIRQKILQFTQKNKYDHKDWRNCMIVCHEWNKCFSTMKLLFLKWDITKLSLSANMLPPILRKLNLTVTRDTSLHALNGCINLTCLKIYTSVINNSEFTTINSGVETFRFPQLQHVVFINHSLLPIIMLSEHNLASILCENHPHQLKKLQCSNIKLDPDELFKSQSQLQKLLFGHVKLTIVLRPMVVRPPKTTSQGKIKPTTEEWDFFPDMTNLQTAFHSMVKIVLPNNIHVNLGALLSVFPNLVYIDCNIFYGRLEKPYNTLEYLILREASHFDNIFSALHLFTNLRGLWIDQRYGFHRVREIDVTYENCSSVFLNKRIDQIFPPLRQIVRLTPTAHSQLLNMWGSAFQCEHLQVVGFHFEELGRFYLSLKSFYWPSLKKMLSPFKETSSNKVISFT